MLAGLALRLWHALQLAMANELFPVEIMAESILGHQGGPALWHTNNICKGRPVCLHSVSLNIGGTTPFDLKFTNEYKKLIEKFKPAVVSDHICFTQNDEQFSFELCPLPRNKATLLHLANRIDQIQDLLQCTLSLENVSAYVSYTDDEMSEIEFLNELVCKTNCNLLLDLNNLYLSAVNNNSDVFIDMESIPWNNVSQIHIAGHSVRDGILFDSHDTPICENVWRLFEKAVPYLQSAQGKTNPIIIIENDNPDTPLELLLGEMQRAQGILDNST